MPLFSATDITKSFAGVQALKGVSFELTDEAYAKLLDKLAGRKFAEVTPELRKNILDFYNTTNVPVYAKKEPEKWNQVLKNIALLKSTFPESTSAMTLEAPPQSDARAPR